MLVFLALVAHPAAAHGAGHEHAPVPTDETPTPIPASYAEVVAALRTRQTDASRAIDEGRLADIHAISRAIADLAVAAASKVADVPGADRGAVALQSLEIKKAAEALHHAADEGDAAGATAAVDQMTKPLLVLSTQPK